MFNHNRWNYRLCKSIKSVYETLDEFPAVFIYLIEDVTGLTGKKEIPVCYWRGRPEDFANPKAEPQWV